MSDVAPMCQSALFAVGKLQDENSLAFIVCFCVGITEKVVDFFVKFECLISGTGF